MYRKLGGVIWPPPPPPLSRFCFAFFSAPPAAPFFLLCLLPRRLFFFLSLAYCFRYHTTVKPCCVRDMLPTSAHSLAAARSLLLAPPISFLMQQLIVHTPLRRARIYIYIFVVVLNCALLSGQIGATRSGGAGRNDRVASCHCPVEARSLFCL